MNFAGLSDLVDHCQRHTGACCSNEAVNVLGKEAVDRGVGDFAIVSRVTREPLNVVSENATSGIHVSDCEFNTSKFRRSEEGKVASLRKDAAETKNAIGTIGCRSIVGRSLSDGRSLGFGRGVGSRRCVIVATAGCGNKCQTNEQRTDARSA